MPQRRSRLTPQFTYDDAAGRYRDAHGRFVPATEVRGALDAYLDAKTAQTRVLAEQLRNREITTRQWQNAMRENLTDIHLASAATAKGGWHRMGQDDYGRVGQELRQQLSGLKNVHRGLQGFADDIESGRYPLDGRFLQRAMQYAQSGRHTYHLVDRLEGIGRGMGEERSVLHAQDSCPGCVAAAAAGWQPIGRLPLPGTRDCLHNCRCTMEQRHGPSIDQSVAGEDEPLKDYSDLLREIESDAARMKEAGASAEEIKSAQQDKIRNASRELALVFSPDGALRFTFQGQSRTISPGLMTPEQREMLRGSDFIHNHPSGRRMKGSRMRNNGVSFSDGDLQSSIDFEFNELRAVTTHQTFIMRLAPDWDSFEKDSVKANMKIMSCYNKAYEAALDRLQNKGGFSEQDAQWLAPNSAMRSVAKLFKVEYKKVAGGGNDE